MPALNAANEELVAGFLGGRVSFADIPRHIETVMGRHQNHAPRSLEDLFEIDGWAQGRRSRPDWRRAGRIDRARGEPRIGWAPHRIGWASDRVS